MSVFDVVESVVGFAPGCYFFLTLPVPRSSLHGEVNADPKVKQLNLIGAGWYGSVWAGGQGAGCGIDGIWRVFEGVSGGWIRLVDLDMS